MITHRLSPRLLLAGCAAALLSACGTLAPDYRRPEASVPAAFPQGGPYPAASGAQTAAPPAWRSTFNDPKLQGLIETSLSENRSLRAAVADVAAARAQYDAQRANLLPTVGANAGASFSRTPLGASSFGTTTGTGGTGTGGTAAPDAVESHVYSAGVGVTSYELDLFGRQRSLSNAAFEQYLATEEGRRAAQLAVIAEVVTEYLNLAADRSLLTLAQQTQASAGETLTLTQRRFEGGIASELDVRQAQTVVEQARADVARYTNLAANDRNALDLAVGRSVDETQTPQSLAEVTPKLADPPAGLSSDILLQRPDVLQAEHQLKAANANIGAARAAFFPQITLTGSVGVASSSLSNLFSGASRAWSFAPGLTLPIFDAGRNRANLRYSEAQRDAAVAQYQNAIQAAFRDVANGLADRAGTERQLEAERALVDAASGALRLATARYQRGSDPYLNTLESQRALYAYQQAMLNVQLARAQNTVTLYRRSAANSLT